MCEQRAVSIAFSCHVLSVIKHSSKPSLTAGCPEAELWLSDRRRQLYVGGMPDGH